MKEISSSNIFVPCQINGNNPPFICIHPIGGGAISYYHLLRGWDKHYPLIAIQAVWERIAHLDSIEALADFYTRELKRCYPQSTYYLGGWSYGGIVAVEIARKLQAEGFQIPQLILYDSYLPDAYIQMISESNTHQSLVLQFVNDIVSQHRIAFDGSCFKDAFSKEDIFNYLIKHKVLHHSMKLWQFLRLFDVYALNRRFYEGYKVNPITLNVHMFRCARLTTSPNNPDEAWQRVCQAEKYQVTYMDADHYGLFSPVMAKQLAIATCKILDCSLISQNK